MWRAVGLVREHTLRLPSSSRFWSCRYPRCGSGPGPVVSPPPAQTSTTVTQAPTPTTSAPAPEDLALQVEQFVNNERTARGLPRPTPTDTRSPRTAHKVPNHYAMVSEYRAPVHARVSQVQAAPEHAHGPGKRLKKRGRSSAAMLTSWWPTRPMNSAVHGRPA